MTKEMYEDLLERNRLQISELNTLTEEQDKHITDLEKENAELKERLKEHENVGNSQFWKNVWAWKTKAMQLTKAKELLKRWVELSKPKLEGYPIPPIQEQTEQFLSEVER